MFLKISFLRNWVAEAITAAGYLGSAAINAYSQHRTNAVNRQQAQYAFSQEQQAIDRQNAYNSPGQQVVRMKSAGLNPSLAYGADGAMVGNQADVPAYNAIPAEAPSIGNAGAALADSIRTGIELKDLERRQALAKAEIIAQDWQNFLNFAAGSRDLATAKETLTLLGYKEQDYAAGIELKWENVLKTREEIANLKESRAEIRSRVKLNEEQVKELAARAGLQEIEAYAILAKLPHELNEMDANAAYAWASSAVGREQVKKIARETQHIGYVEKLETHKYNFDVKSWKVEQEKWNAEMNQNRRMGFVDAFTRIISLGVGAAALRNGVPLAPQRQPSPIITPSGGSMFGQNWAQ